MRLSVDFRYQLEGEALTEQLPPAALRAADLGRDLRGLDVRRRTSTTGKDLDYEVVPFEDRAGGSRQPSKTWPSSWPTSGASMPARPGTRAVDEHGEPCATTERRHPPTHAGSSGTAQTRGATVSTRSRAHGSEPPRSPRPGRGAARDAAARGLRGRRHLGATDGRTGDGHGRSSRSAPGDSARTSLTVATLRQDRAPGCVLVKELIPNDRAESLAAGIDRAACAFDAAAEGTPARETSPWYLPFTPRRASTGSAAGATGCGRAAACGRSTHRACCSMCSNGRRDRDRRSWSPSYLGERPALSANKCTLRRVPVDSEHELAPGRRVPRRRGPHA